MRRRTIEVIRYRSITLVRECTSDPVDSTLAHSISEHLAGEGERTAVSIPTSVTSKAPAPAPPRSACNWLVKRLLSSIATFRNNSNLK